MIGVWQAPWTENPLQDMNNYCVSMEISFKYGNVYVEPVFLLICWSWKWQVNLVETCPHVNKSYKNLQVSDFLLIFLNIYIYIWELYLKGMSTLQMWCLVCIHHNPCYVMSHVMLYDRSHTWVSASYFISVLSHPRSYFIHKKMTIIRTLRFSCAKLKS